RRVRRVALRRQALPGVRRLRWGATCDCCVCSCAPRRCSRRSTGGTFWATTAIAPLFIVYSGSGKRGIPGWSVEEALVVTGWFIVLQAILDGAINPGLQAVVDHIRKGTLDFVLLKPA